MRRAALTLAGLFVAVIAQSSWISQKAVALGQQWSVPKPIAGGDFIPDKPHHRAGIIHSFFPVAPPNGDGEWAEPNEITDFNGFVGVAVVDGTGTDGSGHPLLWEVDLRFMKGVYRGADGDFHEGAFALV